MNSKWCRKCNNRFKELKKKLMNKEKYKKKKKKNKSKYQYKYK